MKRNPFVLVVLVAGILSVGCHKGGSACSPMEPGCGGGSGDTAQIQNVEVDVPDGGVIVPPPGNSIGSMPITFWFSSDLPDNEYVDIETALSQKRDVLTDGWGGKWVKTVREWKNGNPNRVSVGVFPITRKDTTYHYVHIMAFRGFGPDIHIAGGGAIPISALGEMLAHEIVEREITVLIQLF